MCMKSDGLNMPQVGAITFSQNDGNLTSKLTFLSHIPYFAGGEVIGVNPIMMAGYTGSNITTEATLHPTMMFSIRDPLTYFFSSCVPVFGTFGLSAVKRMGSWNLGLGSKFTLDRRGDRTFFAVSAPSMKAVYQGNKFRVGVEMCEPTPPIWFCERFKQICQAA
jgi:hypothetical protein